MGTRFGFVASTDDHLGYPGAYGEGVLGVWAKDLRGESLFEAIRARRTFAASGDRILLEVTLNGKPMGAELPFAAEREIDVRVEGQDSLEMVELIRNAGIAGMGGAGFPTAIKLRSHKPRHGGFAADAGDTVSQLKGRSDPPRRAKTNPATRCGTPG